MSPRYPLCFPAWLLLAWWLVAIPAGAQAPERDVAVAVAPYLGNTFPASPPGAASGWRTTRAYPNLTFTDPMWLVPWPGSGDLLLVERVGRLKRFPADPAAVPSQVTTVLDWRSRTQTVFDEQGFYSAVFHPDFADPVSPRRYLFICYCHRLQEGANSSGPCYWRLTRIEFDAAGAVIPGSETILMSLYDPQQWHNGGAMFFGPDGFLYLSNGDGGGIGNVYGTGQNLDGGLFAGLFRIDVNQAGGSVSHPIRRQPREIAGALPAGVQPSFTANYYIPSSNPWVQQPAPPAGTEAANLEEFYALGLRSPHAMHYDPPTGQVWIGDVGEGAREELDLLHLDPGQPLAAGQGANFGWPVQEGNNGPALPATALGVATRPIHDYGRSTGTCIIGGPVYRGTRLAAQLGGKVLFGDNRSARLWALAHTPGQAPVVEELTRLTDGGTLLGGDVVGLTNICQGSGGEVFLLYSAGAGNPGGRLYTLESTAITPDPPALLSQTGAFTSLAPLVPGAGLLPYTVNSSLWSDHAVKDRWIALPNDGSHDTAAKKITFSRDDNWVFPAGTVLVKHFALPLDLRNPSVTRPLETRFIVCTENGGKYGVTYRWRADGSEADLLAGGASATYPVVQSDGSTVQQTWEFPGRQDCLSCHNSAAGQALGVRTHQLNGSFHYPDSGRVAHQLATWSALGMFDQAPGSQSAAYLRSAALEDSSFPLEHRIRSYLDANCSHCHRPGGPGPGFDARLTVPLANQRLIGEALHPEIEGRFDLIPDSDEDAQIVPGHSALSAVHFRLAHAQPDPVAMPPLAKHVVHRAAVEAMTDWIASLTPEEFEPVEAAPQGRYARFTGLTELNGNPWAAVGELTLLDGAGHAIPPSSLALAGYSSQETVAEYRPATNAIDGNPATHWVTRWSANEAAYPHWLTVDLGSSRALGGFVFQPRTAPGNAVIKDWKLELSADGAQWTPAAQGTFAYPEGPGEVRYDGLAARPSVRSFLGIPAGPVEGAFPLAVIFDQAVDDFGVADLSVANGSVISVQGSGYYFTATIQPAGAGVVTVQLPAGVVAEDGAGNIVSPSVSVTSIQPVEVITGLIGPALRNGGFESPDVAGRTNIATGLIDHWSTWTGQATATDDTGVFDDGGGTGQVLYLQAGGAVANLTGHGIRAGDRFTYGFDHVLAGRPDATMTLVYESDGQVLPIPGTALTGGPVASHAASYTAGAGDPWLGRPVGVALLSAASWPRLDNVRLEVVVRDHYLTWAAAAISAQRPQAPALFEDDADGDGLANGLEWFLCGDPLAVDPGGVMAVTRLARGGATLTFRRAADSLDFGKLVLEWDRDLDGGFAHALEVGAEDRADPETGIQVTTDRSVSPPQVTLRIPATAAGGEGKWFGRLKATHGD